MCKFAVDGTNFFFREWGTLGFRTSDVTTFAPNDKIYCKIQIHLILDADYYRKIPTLSVNLNLKIAALSV